MNRTRIPGLGNITKSQSSYEILDNGTIRATTTTSIDFAPEKFAEIALFDDNAKKFLEEFRNKEVFCD